MIIRVFVDQSGIAKVRYGTQILPIIKRMQRAEEKLEMRNQGIGVGNAGLFLGNYFLKEGGREGNRKSKTSDFFASNIRTFMPKPRHFTS